MRPAGAFALVLLLAAVTAALAPAAGPSIRAVAVAGADLRILLSDGRVLAGRDLAGAVLDLHGAGLQRVVSVQADPRDASGETWLFELSDADSGTPFCLPDPDGLQRALPVPDAETGFRLTCTSGAIGKCIRFGYAPWRHAPDGAPLAPYHAACVRMVRADYGGDGAAWTRDGTLIDIYDRIGVQRADNGPGMTFEAGWSPEGAVCVAHARVPENATLAQLGARYAKLAHATGPDACGEASAIAAGALIFNRSTKE